MAASLQEGWEFLVSERRVPFCETVKSWRSLIEQGRVKVLKYEDLLRNFDAALGSALDYAGLPVAEEMLSVLNEKYSFRNLTKREAGTENVSSHYRNGVAGDWVNYFDANLAEMFNREYGAVCDALAYERPEVVGAEESRCTQR